uniref:Cytochrome b6-f complex subunit 6 n=1 Tax=Boldia erythrosiphon TaxID=74908 RepID=A0A1X9PUW1_9RHOD|nr:cytochrome b6f complex subunit 6 [Boldia erythrosiphon]ARO90503.1 cytochrome b6f complex subunit 6 [Boldia erythrosiphon]
MSIFISYIIFMSIFFGLSTCVFVVLKSIRLI